MQQTQTEQQKIMPGPPDVITTKDHLYLKDMLSWNLCAMKKALFFSQLAGDTDVQSTLEKTCKMHENHYQKLLTHLEKTNPSDISS